MEKSKPSSSQPEETPQGKDIKFSIAENLKKELEKPLDSDSKEASLEEPKPRDAAQSSVDDAKIIFTEVSESTEKETDTQEFDMMTQIQLQVPKTQKPDLPPTEEKSQTKAILPKNPKAQTTTFSYEISERYAESRTVGQGGMGLIRAVEDKNLHRTLAMKILSSKFLDDPSISNAFIEEARITAQLQHPNIIPVHDIGTNKEDGSHFYTMKLVDGESLQDIIDKLNADDQEYKKKYNLYSILNIFRKVCDAVAYAHSKGIIHRDIKPGNVMVGPFGEVLLLDWGLAKYNNSEEQELNIKDRLADATIESPLMTMDGIIKGSLAYLSPEQAEGDIKNVDPQTDIFLLGATLYHMLTLIPPYSSKNMVEIICKAESGDFIHPNEISGGNRIPEAIVNLILKAMSVDKAKRFKTVDEMIQKLSDYIEARNVSDVRTYQKNDLLIHDNDLEDDTFIIISGRVEISRVIDGKSTVLEVLEHGAVFGELAALTHSLRTATARALEETKVMVISKQLMFDEIRKLPPWLEKIIFNLAGKINSMNDRIHPFLLSNCSLPVLKQLLYLFNLVNTNPDNQKTISIEYLGVIHEISQNLGLSASRIEEVIDVLDKYNFAFREKNGRLSLASLPNLKDLITYIRREQNISDGVEYTAVDIDIQKVPILDDIYQDMLSLHYN
ncbi:MAG: serine/threonine-protein kinase [Lentisphaeraceae bacterium]|nr:serine/threonine-protein kinase [Lentisphaeraceae bacterium]